MSTAAHLDESNLLAAFIEGRVSHEERVLVIEHLTRCEACRATVAALARSTDDARPAAAAVRSWISRVPGRPGRRPITWLPIAAAVAIATIASLRLLQAPRPAEIAAPTQRPDVELIPETTPQPSVPPSTKDSGSASSPSVDSKVLPRRAAERRVLQKTFRLEAGEWVDTSYDPIAGLPEVRTETPAETRAVLDRVPALVPYTVLGTRVLIVFDGTVYRLRVDSTR